MLAIGGLLFTADLSIWHWSLQYTTVTNSTLLTNVAPIFVTLGARWFFGDRIKLSFVFGMLLAISGATLLIRNSVVIGADATATGLFSSKHLLGDVLSILAAVFYAGYLLAVKHLRKTFSTPTIMSWCGTVSCAGFGLVAWLSDDRMAATSSKGWGVLLALAIVSHAGGQTLIAYGFGHLPASFSSVSLLWQPVVAAMVAWLVLDEQLTWLQGVGALIVLAGIAAASGTIESTRRRVTPS